MCGRLSVKIMAGLLFSLWCFATLAGCSDSSGTGQEQAEESSAGLETAAAPGVMVGGVFLPLPAPEGFARLEEGDPRLAALRAGLQEGRVLLAAFAREEGADESAQPGQACDSLLVTTLRHWQRLKFSAGGFDAVKADWQDSVPCTQAVLLHFEEAAAGSLSSFEAYTYNLGLAGYGPRQISFASVVKSPASASSPGEDPGLEAGAEPHAAESALFVCTVRSLIYRQGKILGLEYRQRLGNFSEIATALDGHLDYLDELQLLDGQPEDPLASGFTSESKRFVPEGKPELSAVTRP